MIKIGLLSDTHSHFDAKLRDLLKDVDQIWHAGDVGDISVIEELKKICPIVKGVYGNIDGRDIRNEFPEHLIFEEEGLKIWMTHIGGYPNKYPSAIKTMLSKVKPNIFICGHSHILRVMRDTSFDNMIVMNPGAAGTHGWHKVKTLLRFKIDNGKLIDLEAVELGKRGAIE